MHGDVTHITFRHFRIATPAVAVVFSRLWALFVRLSVSSYFKTYTKRRHDGEPTPQ